VKVQLNGNVTNPIDFCLGQSFFGFVSYSGTYRPQPTKFGPGGSFEVTVQDRGEPGPSNGDYIKIVLFGGIYDGYSNFGSMQGGNIQFYK